ncbi:MAG: hypothetical protein BWX73_03286 [Lentisphaerae bacterium ADurb.Bin082]|nr:MAG: hypothetical protein BWX73_03286 [Lentisphaerae bacterium ADurb.Bin082]
MRPVTCPISLMSAAVTSRGAEVGATAGVNRSGSAAAAVASAATLSGGADDVISGPISNCALMVPNLIAALSRSSIRVISSP